MHFPLHDEIELGDYIKNNLTLQKAYKNVHTMFLNLDG